MPSAGTAWLDIEGRLAPGFQRDLERMVAPGIANVARKAGDQLTAFGASTQALGRQLTLGLTLPIAAIGGVAIKSAIDFETAFAGVRKTVNATEDQFATLRQGIRDMSKEVPESASNIAAVAEAAGQLGIKTDAILGFTRVMVDLGVTTNLSATEAATALARLANITQLPQDQFDRLGSTIVALGNNLATTEAEIVEMGLRIAGAGKQVGLSEAQILSFAGALSSVGIEAQAGGSAISRTFIEIAQSVEQGGKKLETFARVAGMSTQEFQRAFQQDAAGAIIAFIEGLGKLESQGESTFGVLDELGLSEVRVRDAMLRASGAGDLFRESLELGSQAWEDNLALTNEAAQRYDTTASKFAIFKNRLQDAAITLGDALIPALTGALDAADPLIGVITGLAQAFAGLPDWVQKTIIGFALLLASVGPVTFVIGAIASAIGGLLKLVPALSVALGFLAAHPVIGALALLAGAIAFVGFQSASLSTRIKEIEAELNAHFAPAVNNAALALESTGKAAKDAAVNAYVAGTGFKDLDESARRLNEQLPAAREALTGLAETSGVSAERIVQLANAMGINLATATEDQKESLSGAIAEISRAVVPTERLAAVQETLGNEVATTTEQFDAFKEAVDAALGVQLTADQAAVRYAETVDRLAKSIAENGTVTGVTTEKQRNLSTALIDVVSAAQSEVDAMVRSGRISADAAVQKQELINRLNNLKTTFPALAGPIDTYIGHLNAIPDSVSTTVVAHTDEAERKFGRLAGMVRSLPRRIQMFAGVTGRDGDRQHGGPVWPGTWLVGEDGPELIHLNSGTYGQVDNAQETRRMLTPAVVGGARSVTVTTYNDIRGTGDKELMAALERAADERDEGLRRELTAIVGG